MKVSWRTFDQDKTQRGPRRRAHRARRRQGRPAVRGHRRGVVDRGADGRRWRCSRTSSRTRSSRRRPSSCARARTSSSSSPTPSAPARRPTSCGSRKFEHDTEKANNEAVMTAPVKGKPEHPLRRGRRAARARLAPATSQRALEHENIDVEVRGPARPPVERRRSSRSTTSSLVSDVPAHLIGAGQMAALDSLRQDMGGGLIMAGGEDSFGSGGYERTRSSRSCRCGSTPRRSRSSPTSRSCS